MNDDQVQSMGEMRARFVQAPDATDQIHNCLPFAVGKVVNDPTMEPAMRRMIEWRVRNFLF